MNALMTAPALLLAGGALATMIASTTRMSTRGLLLMGAFISAVAGVLAASQAAGSARILSDMLVLDAYSAVVTTMVALCGSAVLLLSLDSRRTATSYRGEYVTLVLVTVLGASLMASTEDFIAFFLALQLSSLPLYVLTGFNVRDPLATEAATKFLLLGMLASVLMIYGFSVGFVHSPASSFAAMAPAEGTLEAVTIVALVFVLAGFAFKIGAAPMHFWIPDTYQGSSAPITALLSTVPKLGAIAALARFASIALSGVEAAWTLDVIAGLAVASMVLGNLIALTQTDVKRMLAYSSIAHGGYLLVALATGANGPVVEVVLFYAVIYALTNIGAFAVLGTPAAAGHSLPLDSLSGLWRRAPLEAAILALLVISMLGLPPTPGFWAKFGVVMLAVESGRLWLAVVVVATSAVSIVYYMRIVRTLFITDSAEPALAIGKATRLVVAVIAATTIAVGLWPAGLNSLASLASAALGGGG